MTKRARYEALMPMVEAYCQGEPDRVAKMANVAALLHREFGFWWTGFYRVVGDQLVLGPFQGPPACTRIGYGKGVCGTAWKERRSVVVADVEQFEGHIACSSESKSEVVVPLWQGDEVVGVLDIDSEHLSMFDEEDCQWLERVCKIVMAEWVARI